MCCGYLTRTLLKLALVLLLALLMGCGDAALGSPIRPGRRSSADMSPEASPSSPLRQDGRVVLATARRRKDTATDLADLSSLVGAPRRVMYSKRRIGGGAFRPFPHTNTFRRRNNFDEANNSTVHGYVMGLPSSGGSHVSSNQQPRGFPFTDGSTFQAIYPSASTDPPAPGPSPIRFLGFPRVASTGSPEHTTPSPTPHHYYPEPDVHVVAVSVSTSVGTSQSKTTESATLPSSPVTSRSVLSQQPNRFSYSTSVTHSDGKDLDSPFFPQPGSRSNYHHLSQERTTRAPASSHSFFSRFYNENQSPSSLAGAPASPEQHSHPDEDTTSTGGEEATPSDQPPSPSPQISDHEHHSYAMPEQNYEVDESVSVMTNGRAHGIQTQSTSPPRNQNQSASPGSSPGPQAPPKKEDNKSGYVVEGRNFRKYRVEEKTSDGFIVGEYGVVSHDDGSLRGVRYTADSTINPRLIYDALVKFLSL